jgi:hypothetical protein
MNPISTAILTCCVQTYTSHLMISSLDVEDVARQQHMSNEAVVRHATKLGVWVFSYSGVHGMVKS